MLPTSSHYKVKKIEKINYFMESSQIKEIQLLINLTDI